MIMMIIMMVIMTMVIKLFGNISMKAFIFICENRNTEEPEETGASDGYSEQGA